MKKKIYVFPIMIGILLVFSFISIYFFQMEGFPPRKKKLDPLMSHLPKALQENLVNKFGLDKPWHEKYFYFIRDCSAYNLGPSYRHQNLTVNQLVAMRAPASALFISIAGILVLASLFLKAKKPRKTWVRLFQICALILLSVINMYFIYQYGLRVVIAMLVFIGCLLFLCFRRDGKSLNYTSTVLVILSLFQLFIFENILGIKGVSFYLPNAVKNRDYTLIWGVQYTLFLMAALTGVLISYVGVYFSRSRG